MKTKLLILGSLVCLILSSSVAFAADFSDVDGDHENFAALYFLHNSDVVNGYDVDDSDNPEFRPANNINRAEFLKLIMEGLDVADGKNRGSCFPDVDEEAWYATYVCQAKEMGVVAGYPDGNFKPGQNLIEAEALKIVGEIANWELEEAGDDEQWYQPYLDYAESVKVLDEGEVGRIVNRGDIAEIIFRNQIVEEFDGEEYMEERIVDFYDAEGVDYCANGEMVLDVEDIDCSGEVEEEEEELEEEEEEVVVIDADVEVAFEIFNTNISVNADIEGAHEIEIHLSDIESAEKLSGREVQVLALAGRDYIQELAVSENGNGVYMASFNPSAATDYDLKILDVASGEYEFSEITVVPGAFDHLEVLKVEGPEILGTGNQARVQVISKDAHGNIVPFSENENDIGATTDAGTLETSHDDKGVFTFNLAVDDWGRAELSFFDKTDDSSFDLTQEFWFFPVQVNVPKGINEDTKEVEVMVYVYMPEKYGKLGEYDIDLSFDSNLLQVVRIEDPYTFDRFAAPELNVNNIAGGIALTQQNSHITVAVNQTVEVASIIFEAQGEVGVDAFVVANAVFKNTSGQVKDYLENFAEATGEVETDDIASTLSELYWKWDFAVKEDDAVCIDVYAFSNSGATNGEVEADAIRAEGLFHAAADAGVCSSYLDVAVNSYNLLNRSAWREVDRNNNDILDPAELTFLDEYESVGKCRSVFYVPGIADRKAAWVLAGDDAGIAIDEGGDSDELSLAYAIIKMVSGVAMDDGAGIAKNLFNLNDGGEKLSPEQCAAFVEGV
jgi:hypothetical protein